MASIPSFPLSFVKVDQIDGVATISVDRPESLNSINPAVVHQLQQAFDRAAADSAVRGIAIVGTGKAFIAGADVGFLLRAIESHTTERILAFTEAGHALFNAIDSCPKPVTAFLDGVAIGAGVEIALACDRIVVSRRASFCLPETGLGIYPGLGGSQRLPRRIGVGLAKWMIFTGKTITASDAQKIGLADELVSNDDIRDVSRLMFAESPHSQKPKAAPPEFAAMERFFLSHSAEELRTGAADAGGDPALARAMKQVAAKAPISLQYAETLIDEGMKRTLAEGLQLEIDRVLGIYATADAYIGLSSRIRRQIGLPAFKGE